MGNFKVKIEFRPSGRIETKSIIATDPQSAAKQVRDLYKNQQIIIVTVKAQKAVA